MKLLRPDAYYHLLVLTPRSRADQAQFTMARLAPWRQTLLPRQIEFLEVNGDKTVWDIPKIDTNPKLGPAHFQRPQLPAGWRTVPVSPPPATGEPIGATRIR